MGFFTASLDKPENQEFMSHSRERTRVFFRMALTVAVLCLSFPGLGRAERKGTGYEAGPLSLSAETVVQAKGIKFGIQNNALPAKETPKTAEIKEIKSDSPFSEDAAAEIKEETVKTS